MARPLQSPLAPLQRSMSTGLLTPPASPTKPVLSSTSREHLPEYFAVKLPTNQSAVRVLVHEAKILSHLTQVPGHHDYIVPFHGFDVRNNSVVLTALRENLESVIKDHLSKLDEPSRTAVVCKLFPRLARSLIKSLAWLHVAGVIHADIKPANILLRPDRPVGANQRIADVPFTPLIADFTSSSGREDSSTSDSSSSTSPLGGGTYDYLAPEMLRLSTSTPSKAADVYALGITLFYFITGVSPFTAARGNRFQLLEMIKAGKPLEFAMENPQSARRLQTLATQVKRRYGIDVLHLLKLGLEKDSSKRITAQQWSEMF
jgi:serine/threonine protein kinase